MSGTKTIHCDNCGHDNPAGSLLCKNCFEVLTSDDEPRYGTTHNLSTQNLRDIFASEPIQESVGDGVFTNGATLRIKIHGFNIELSKKLRNGTLVFGRADPAKRINPDIDLVAYDAYKHGVSRYHALLRREGNKLIIRDLNSSNGTYINGEKLIANIPQQIFSGDTVRLGTLVMQIYY